MEIFFLAGILFMAIIFPPLFTMKKDGNPTIPEIYTVENLKIIPQGRNLPNLFVITEEGEVINLKYDSETFAKLKIGDKISISEGTFDDKIHIIKSEL